MVSYSAPYLYVSAGDSEIGLVISADNGATFSDELNLTNTPYGVSYMPVTVADGNTVYLTHIDTFGSPRYPMSELFFRAVTGE
jgi:hypothetical protein